MEPKGNASAETNWKRLVRDRSDIEELADDLPALLDVVFTEYPAWARNAVY